MTRARRVGLAAGMAVVMVPVILAGLVVLAGVALGLALSALIGERHP